MPTLGQRKRMFARRRLARSGAPMRKRKFLRKYTRGLGSPEKIYAFKRIAQKISIQNKTVTGVPVFDITQPTVAGYPNSVQIGLPENRLNDVVSAPLSMTFRLSDVQASGDFQALFDQYKISGVKVKITWTNTQAISGFGVPAPRMMYCTDTDDAEVPTEALMRQKNDTKFHQFVNGVPLVLYLKPKASKEIYNTALTSAYSPTRSYIDCINQYVPHYGMKAYLDDLYCPTGIEFDSRSKFHVDISYYLKLKGVQ